MPTISISGITIRIGIIAPSNPCPATKMTISSAKNSENSIAGNTKANNKSNDWDILALTASKLLLSSSALIRGIITIVNEE